MPNWASSKVTISGDCNVVTEIKERLAKPYISPHSKDKSEREEGVFLLWNIVSPTNLRAYTGQEQKEFDEIIKANNLVPDTFEETKQALEDKMSAFQDSLQDGSFFAELQHKLATSDEWYEWNCRNWGTKWDTSGSVLEYELPTYPAVSDTSIDEPMPMNLELGYRMETAWSPPYEALQKLAEQYPQVTISLVSIDENDLWAMSAQWADGQEFCEDLEIDHEIGMELRGYCNLECCNDYE